MCFVFFNLFVKKKYCLYKRDIINKIIQHTNVFSYNFTVLSTFRL